MQEEYIKTTKYGTTTYFKDKAMTILHREDGPAIEYDSGEKAWYVDGKLHRTDGPAVTTAEGRKEWWTNGKLHRLDEPAVEHANGLKEWWVNDVFIFTINRNGRVIGRMR